MLYVDVDAVFHKNPWPPLDSMNADLGVFYATDDRLISATIYLDDTPETLDLLKDWKQGCDAEPEIWDQVTLQKILERHGNGDLKIERLPVSFCWIFDRLKNVPTDVNYIEQLQASRQATKRKRLFGRVGKRLTRRQARVEEIERILASDP